MRTKEMIDRQNGNDPELVILTDRSIKMIYDGHESWLPLWNDGRFSQMCPRIISASIEHNATSGSYVLKDGTTVEWIVTNYKYYTTKKD